MRELALLGGLFLITLVLVLLGSLLSGGNAYFLTLGISVLVLFGGTYLLSYLKKKGLLAKIPCKTPLFLSKLIEKNGVWGLTFKVLGVLLVAFFLVRFVGGHDYLEYVETLYGSDFLSPFEVVITLVVTLFYNGAMMLLAVSCFVPSVLMNNLRKWLVTPIYVLTIFFTPYFLYGIGGNVFVSTLDYDPHGFRLAFMGLEIAVGAFLLIKTWVDDPSFRFPKGFVLPYLAIWAIFICAIPNSYTFSVLFGGRIAGIPMPLDINYTHRAWIYIAFILPVFYFLVLRNFDVAHRRAFLTFIAYMAYFGYAGRLRWEIWTSIESIPLHLCNTAMYVIPLILTFKTTKVFYFTMFVNVIGALIAILMPNYSHDLGVFSIATLEFHINHIYAFFMPVLIVLLGIYPRPKMKYFFYSMVGFLFYFIVCLVVNTTANAYGHNVDFFFISSNYVAGEIGDWAEEIFAISWTFEINGTEFTIHPPYLIAFYAVYVALAFAMWYVYELLFHAVDGLEELLGKRKDEKTYMLNWRNSQGRRPNMDNRERPARIEINHLRKSYGKKSTPVVEDFSLTVEGGKIYGFLGKNGAGKSTIIKSIVGMHDFEGGEIHVCGYDVKAEAVEAKSTIGFVPDHYALYESLSGRQYVNYIADLFGVSQADRDARLADLLPRLSMEKAFDSPIGTYSHGMKQKVTIISSLVHDPKVWILDEPMTGVDPVSIFEIKETMKEHARKGNIVFFSSHLIDVVGNLCDEIVMIKKGKLVYRGEVEKLREEKVDLEELFLKLS